MIDTSGFAVKHERNRVLIDLLMWDSAKFKLFSVFLLLEFTEMYLIYSLLCILNLAFVIERHYNSFAVQP